MPNAGSENYAALHQNLLPTTLVSLLPRPKGPPYFSEGRGPGTAQRSSSGALKGRSTLMFARSRLLT